MLISMQFQRFLHILLISYLAKSAAAEDEDLTNLSTTIQTEMYDIVKKLPLMGCTIYCSVNASNLKFYWHSDNTPQNGTLLDVSNPTLINKDKITVLIFFGWFGHSDLAWVQNMTNIFITKYNFDVVVVDWSAWSRGEYVTASNVAKCIGFLVGELLANLHQNYSVPVDNLKLVGFSLGGQVSGFAGKKFTDITGQKLALIVAIDPAGPCFNPNSEKERLSSTDAKQVYVIHCNAFEFGMNFACGTLDVWVNNGCLQPGCVDTFVTNPTDIGGNVACSHFRCYQVFIQALQHPQELMADKCGPWTGCGTAESTGPGEFDLGQMDPSKTGEYCLNTTNNTAFYNN